ncbi:MAG TPA: group I intron-associated PD-(D/E)XK endonuclease [Candidatus Sulfotelmatobacter sp.]|nr:group I intron-associated PD-(D/E)XK endonuclease [Candidatus Sulfotelmatobacter sp.]
MATTVRCEIKNCKARGEWAELCFMARAAAHGYSVTRPFGDSASYDVGVEHCGRFSRVQVKSTTCRERNCYKCQIGHFGGEPYTENELDFFAIYLVPIDLWYLIPFEVAQHSLSLRLAPNNFHHRFSQYIEAWHLLRGDEGRV